MLNNLKKFLRNIIFISTAFSSQLSAQFLFTPFQNESSFNGEWNLEEEIPNYIAAYFRERYKSNVLSSTAFISLANKYDSAEKNFNDLSYYSKVADEIGFNYLVLGTIQNFDVGRFSAGETNIAGYEAYSCNIELSIQIYDLLTNAAAFAGKVESSVSNKGVGLNLFGLPSDEKKQYFALNKIRFGSEEFHKTIVGEAMLQLCDNLTSDIEAKSRELLHPKKQNKSLKNYQDESLSGIKLDFVQIKGQILTYDEETGEAFVNIGSSSKINVGDELLIYSEADSLFDSSTKEFLGFQDKYVTSLQIIEIRGEKLCLALVRNNKDKVEKGMQVRKLIFHQLN